MQYSLLDWANNFDAAPSPLPPHSERRTRRAHGSSYLGAWPADLLPADAIALDLADLGVSYQRGRGYTINGSHREPDQIAQLAVDTIVAAADRLPQDRERAYNAAATQIEVEIEHDLEVLLDQADPSDPLLGDLYDATTVFGGDFLRRGLDEAIASGAIREADQRAKDDLAGLRYTAKELRTSVAARSRLLANIRPHLPAPRPNTDPDKAEAFLATLDDRASIRRSAVPRLYANAGSPGGLDPAEIRALATARWGAPRHLDGHPTYRPAQAESGPRPASTGSTPARPKTPIQKASEYVAARYDFMGDLPARTTLAELFAIELHEADEILAPIRANRLKNFPIVTSQ